MYVYILRSLLDDRRHYVGLSHDVNRRLEEHNRGKSIHSNKYRPWKVLVSLWFEDEETAERFERYLKSASGRAFTSRHFG